MYLECIALKSRLKISLAFILALLVQSRALAQFSISSNDAASLKWYSIRTENFEVIYPKGEDSLAKVYIHELEKWRPEVSRSINVDQKHPYRHKALPVILHTQNAASNGVVTWAPRRMELNTIPDWNSPDPIPWHTSLAIHEGRHAIQMKQGYTNVFRPLYYVLGEMIPGAYVAYPGRMLLEGDAVVAETAFSRSGRGRNSDFMKTYMLSWDKGDRRSYLAWRCDSYYKPTPDVYAFGYALISGARTLYDKPLFMQDYFSYVSRRPYDPWPLRHTLRRNSGKKFMAAYNEIMDHQYQLWAADTLSRGPFMPKKRLSHPQGHMVWYSNALSTSDTNHVYWIKKDMYDIPGLICMDVRDGRERKLLDMSASAANVDYIPATNSIVWNELQNDPRWGQKRSSVICTYDMDKCRLRRITPLGEHYFFPTSIGGDSLAVIHYGEDCHEHIDFIRLSDNRVYQTWNLPDSLQMVEMSWAENHIYTVGMSEKGTGIYLVTPHSCKEVLPPIPFNISCVDVVDENSFTFQSDRSGSSELYMMNIHTGELCQLTHTKFGGDAFCLMPDGSVVYSYPCEYGDEVAVTEAAFLDRKPVDWTEYYHFPVADKLTRQEEELRSNADSVSRACGLDVAGKLAADVQPSEPKRYYKLAHAARLHSWAPAYVDIDAVQNMSFENIKKIASLGAMAFFQNDMSTFSGYAGYKARNDRTAGKWFHSGHVNLTYSGLYPVFEGEFHVNDRDALNYVWEKDEKGQDVLKRVIERRPYMTGGLRTYIPLQWNRHSHFIGFTPTVNFSMGNDHYEGKPYLGWYGELRGYFMHATPSSAIYPRWGIGAQLRYSSAHYGERMSLSSSFALAYVYGYLPGIGWGQGLKLGVLWQKDLNPSGVINPGTVSLLPRGIEGVALYEGTRLSVDYAAPFPMGDWHISDVFYCKRGIVTPHYDCTLFQRTDGIGTLMSLGLDFEMEFGAFLWIKVPMTFGVRCGYNFGNSFSLVAATQRFGSFYIGPLFNIQIP